MKEHKPKLKICIIPAQRNHFCSCCTVSSYKRNTIGRELLAYLSTAIRNNLFQRRVRARYLSEVPDKKSYSEVKKRDPCPSRAQCLNEHFPYFLLSL